MQCPHCGIDNTDPGSQFCYSCGGPLAADAPPVNPDAAGQVPPVPPAPPAYEPTQQMPPPPPPVYDATHQMPPPQQGQVPPGGVYPPPPPPSYGPQPGYAPPAGNQGGFNFTPPTFIKDKGGYGLGYVTFLRVLAIILAALVLLGSLIYAISDNNFAVFIGGVLVAAFYYILFDISIKVFENIARVAKSNERSEQLLEQLLQETRRRNDQQK